jgi:hypothetical protein
LPQKRSREKPPVKDVKGGLEKIAFGGVGDAISLLFTNEADIAQLKGMDFYNIAEIKRLKTGIEIKFYDRMKAMQCLNELEKSGGTDSPLYRALEKCTGAFEEGKGNGV